MTRTRANSAIVDRLLSIDRALLAGCDTTEKYASELRARSEGWLDPRVRPAMEAAVQLLDAFVARDADIGGLPFAPQPPDSVVEASDEWIARMSEYPTTVQRQVLGEWVVAVAPVGNEQILRWFYRRGRKGSGGGSGSGSGSEGPS